MEVTSEHRGSVTIITISGKFDATTVKDVEAYINGVVDAEHSQVVLDLGDVSYLSSAGIRAMLATMQNARRDGGDLRLAKTTGNILRVITTAGFPKIMKLYDTLDEAVESFNA